MSTRRAIVALPGKPGAGEKSDTGGTTKGALRASALAALNTSSGAAGTGTLNKFRLYILAITSNSLFFYPIRVYLCF